MSLPKKMVEEKRKSNIVKLKKELDSALKRLKRQEEKLKKMKEIEKTYQEQEALYAEIYFIHELTKLLAKTLDLDEVAKTIMDGLVGILGAEMSFLYLLDPEKNELFLKSSQGINPKFLEKKIKVGQGILGQSVSSGKLINIDDLEKSAFKCTIFKKTPKSISAVPLVIKERVLGALGIASKEKRNLTKDELERLSEIGQMSAAALQNALFYQEIEKLSVTDRLTELYNHGHFHQRLEEELSRARRFGLVLSLIMIDIDHFKKFNDTFGHPKGDLVLKRMGKVLRQNVREIDIVARYGGEEFVVALPQTDKEKAFEVAEKIRKAFENETFEGNKKHPLVRRTISLGVATYPIDATKQSDLIACADQALYLAKRRGRNRVVNYKSSNKKLHQHKIL